MQSTKTTLAAMLLRAALAGSALGFVAAFGAGCNTIEGAGEDVEAAGEGVEGAADETGDDLGVDDD